MHRYIYIWELMTLNYVISSKVFYGLHKYHSCPVSPAVFANSDHNISTRHSTVCRVFGVSCHNLVKIHPHKKYFISVKAFAKIISQT